MTDERQEVSEAQFEVIKAVLGADAETFKRTKVGQYITDRIEREEEQLIEELIIAALGSKDMNVMQLALNINMRRALPMFIDEAIQSGHNAQDNLEQMDSSEQPY